MRKDIKNIITYGGLAAGAIALFNAVTKPAAAAPAVSGLGVTDPYMMTPDEGNIMQVTPPNNIMQVHPHNYAPSHPWWRWWRRHRMQDANSSVQNYQALPWYQQPGNTGSTFESPYGPAGDYPYGGYGGGYYGGGYFPWDYNAGTIEQPGSLAYLSAQLGT